MKLDYSIFPSEIAKKVSSKIDTFASSKRGCRTRRYHLDINLDKEASLKEEIQKIKIKLYNIFKKIYMENLDETTECYLCKEQLTVKNFMVDARIDGDGIQGCHIIPLEVGVMNHNANNIELGHRDCNIMQGNRSVEETLMHFEKILKAHGRL